MIGKYGGRQGVSIGEGCERLGVIEHEIGHALGLWHEQSRPDAGEYIEVEKDFILPSYTSDFQMRSINLIPLKIEGLEKLTYKFFKGTNEINTLGIPYDYGSVMHYGSTAFSADGMSKTLLTRDPNYQYTIGQRERLSFYDIQVINKAYCEDAKCGAVLTLKDEWRTISSPNYEEDGYIENQMCSWILKAPKKQRIEIEFLEEFSFLCATTCVDYVELKLSKDQRNTGPRFCCYHKPEKSLISEGHQVAVIFRSQIGQDIGFKLQARATMKMVELKKQIIKTTTQKPTTIAGHNILSSWGQWSECSRPCGGCGIKSRVRICETAECE
uniref:Metalloendopeptidase n=1 Tax=Panagrolaimus davidi TaxID=227884 RepID=A0A914R335_9BILA